MKKASNSHIGENAKIALYAVGFLSLVMLCLICIGLLNRQVNS
jgi:hypothetical protein